MTGFAELAHAAHAALAARPTVRLALATLVDVEGSSYRQPGARLLVDAEGRVLAGAISGGCLEGDVAARASDVCASGQAVALRYDLRDDLETIWGFGSACDGIAHLVLEPLHNAAWLADAAAVRAERTNGALLVIARGSGVLGTAAMLRGEASGGRWAPVGLAGMVTVDQTRASTLAGVAQRTMQAEGEQFDDVRYFVEPLTPVVSLYLVGAGRGAEAFAHIATTMGWEVTLIDHREAMLVGLSLPPGVRTLCARADEGALQIPRDGRTAVALLSHVYDIDAAWLTALLPHPAGYVGVLGSRQRATRLVAEVMPSADATRVVHAPIGLDLGGESPESIALSAIAEIEAVMHGRPGGFLRERESPLHTRTPTPLVSPRHGAEEPPHSNRPATATDLSMHGEMAVQVECLLPPRPTQR